MSGAEVVRTWLRRVGERDVDGELELWADGGVLHFPFAPPPAPTRVTAGPQLRAFRTAVGPLVPRLDWYDVEIHELVDPALLFVTARTEGVARNGRPFTGRYAMLFRFRDGRIERIDEYADPAAVTRAFTPEELSAARLVATAGSEED